MQSICGLKFSPGASTRMDSFHSIASLRLADRVLGMPRNLLSKEYACPGRCDRHIPAPTPHHNRRSTQKICVGALPPEANAQEEILARAQAVDGGETTPWALLIQQNERHLKWEADARVQLITKVLTERLNLSEVEVAGRLQTLSQLVPDLSPKMGYTRTDILLRLITDLQTLTTNLLRLRELLPAVNVSMLVSRTPSLVLDWEMDALEARLNEMSTQLPGVNVAKLIDTEPAVLKANLPKVLAHCLRLLPNEDPVHVLITRPQMVLDMQESGMASALDVEGYAPRQ